MNLSSTVDRTAELLEFFASEPEPPCGFRVQDVVQALGFAQSTASVLLIRLAELGYLRRADRHYFPTPRLGVLGKCYLDNHPDARQLEELLSQINESTGHLSFLAHRNGPNLQYISFKSSMFTRDPAPRNGIMRPLVIAASGRALLSLLNPNDAKLVIRRNNSEGMNKGWWVKESEVMDDLRTIRERGFARSDPLFTPGLIGFASLLVTGNNRIPYAIGVAIPAHSSSKDADSIIRALADLKAHFDKYGGYETATGDPSQSLSPS